MSCQRSGVTVAAEAERTTVREGPCVHLREDAGGGFQDAAQRRLRSRWTCSIARTRHSRNRSSSLSAVSTSKVKGRTPCFDSAATTRSPSLMVYFQPRKSLPAQLGDGQGLREAEVAADLIAQVAGLPGDVEVLECGPLPGDEISHTAHLSHRDVSPPAAALSPGPSTANSYRPTRSAWPSRSCSVRC